MTMSHCFSFYR